MPGRSGAEDLSFELRDRPLLLLFRPIAWAKWSRIELVCAYVCVVAIRHEATDPAVHVLLPSDQAWSSRITRDEFVVGWCHGSPASSRPTRRLRRFRVRWNELVLPGATDVELRQVLHEAFVPPGSDSRVDFGTEPIRIVTEFGRVIVVNPLLYARTRIGPSRPSPRLDADFDTDDESPSEVLAVGLSRGRPLPRDIPAIARSTELADPGFVHGVPGMASTPRVHELPVSATPSPVQAATTRPQPTSTGQADGVLAVLAEFARTTQMVLAQQAEAQQTFQSQLLERLHAPATPLPPTVDVIVNGVKALRLGLGYTPIEHAADPAAILIVIIGAVSAAVRADVLYATAISVPAAGAPFHGSLARLYRSSDAFAARTSWPQLQRHPRKR
ncbi:hypothetical protein PHYSODRAFT_323234 [Phytophthora sojae]|uniref:Uncharacterized protein n=1 Tax=Phytophthora sojae (strain P6497) TaxID=1094619 RepID=G4YL05_PHYSP|nr:hypothetical protein PHYSODRAFT_323234 [Phytophthora sojae]EGZ29760.1 hypothetical protein PHYSODRAFT_323234 [Phytophthora sojae]|eukprot:XP_009517035.1 hypothetical protein PHYSODRAFT_323234 [Phytophthora sojae]